MCAREGEPGAKATCIYIYIYISLTPDSIIYILTMTLYYIYIHMGTRLISRVLYCLVYILDLKLELLTYMHVLSLQ